MGKKPDYNAQSSAVITLGIAKSLMNARDLVADADLLYSKKRYPRAFALALLAREEIGKAKLLMSALLSKELGQGVTPDLQKAFSSHQEKGKRATEMYLLWLELFFNKHADKASLAKYSRYKAKLRKELNNPQNFDERKQEAFYVGFDDDTGKYKAPTHTIKWQECKSTIESTRLIYDLSYVVLIGIIQDLPNSVKLLENSPV